MKTIFSFILIVTLASTGMRSQGMPVYDNTNFIALGKSLIESAKQTSELLKTVKFLKEQKEKIEQVNSVLKQLKMVREITQNNQKLFEMVQNDLREIINSPFIKAEEINTISDSFNSLIDIALEDLNFMQGILTSNFLNMTDSERILLLEEQKHRSRQMVDELQRKKRRYEQVIEFRKLHQKINQRETGY
ncbi:MAG: conjugal transfer protein [Bacteroidota bacterium]